jgi:hypothetical protein
MKDELQIIDIMQTSPNRSVHLVPIWKSSGKHGQMKIINTPPIWSTVDGAKFVRLFLESHHGKRSILDIPLYDEIRSPETLRLIPIPNPTPITSRKRWFSRTPDTTEELFADAHHGLVVQTGLVEVHPRTSSHPMPMESRRMCPLSITADVMTAFEDHDTTRGIMRLGQQTPEGTYAQLGVMSDWQALTTKAERRFSIDDISGRFVRHTQYPAGDHNPTVVLYAFDL